MKKQRIQILDTNNFYAGYNTEEECMISGNYWDLLDDENIESETVEWDEDFYNDEKENIINLISEEIKNYAKRYNLGDWLDLIIMGDIGHWTGRREGIKRLHDIEDIFSYQFFGNYDDLYINIEENGTLTITTSDHDGASYFTIYVLNDNRIDRIGAGREAYPYDIETLALYIDEIKQHYKPLKISKKNKYNYYY